MVVVCGGSSGGSDLFVCAVCCCGLTFRARMCAPAQDPRFPHGVRQVQGTRDPRKGRLVLHGACVRACVRVCEFECECAVGVAL